MSYDFDTRASSAPRISRRSAIASALVFSTFATVAPAWAQTATPASLAEGDADAVEVLKAAGAKVLELDTFSFSIDTIAGSSTIFPGVELESVEGEVQRPMDLSATLAVKAFTQTLTIGAVVIDGTVYVQDPFSAGAWQNLGSAPQVASLINPEWILVAAINLIKDAAITSEKDGVTLIEGYIHLSETLGELDEQELQQVEQFLATTPVDVAFWINEDNLITRAELYGPIFASETPDVEKRIDLFGFNEPVDIEAPDI